MPSRRAGSPVQVSPSPRTANRTPAMCSSSATARVVFLARSSSAPAQPTQNRYSTSVEVLDVPPTTGTSKSSSLVQSRRALGAHAPRVAPVLQVAQHHAGLGRERRLDQHLVAAHVDDVVDVLDVDRALLDAGAAGGAGPQHVGVDDPALLGGADQRPCACGALVPACARSRTRARRGAGRARRSPRRRRTPRPAPFRRRAVRGLGEQVVAQVHDHQLGRQRLAGVPRRALGLAAPALGAGGEVEHALPGEVLDLAAAEDVSSSSRRVLEVDRLAAGVIGSSGPSAFGSRLDSDVERRQEDVQVLGVDDEDQEAEHDADLGQEADRLERPRWRPRRAAPAARRRPRRRTPPPSPGTGRRRC